jgi:4-diphosphocytidyl-2-C-methyl-D-erythritol kinase
MPIRSIAPAKLNLFLHVTGKREDGYHFLESMIAFTPNIHDQIEIENSSKEIIIEEAGSFLDRLPIDNKNNIIYRAATFLKNGNDGVVIKLHKNIPIGGGLGGGSSDAATVTRMLKEVWGINLTKKELDEKLIKLGADVPICFHGKIAYFSGIGEVIEDINIFPKIYAIVINPMQPLLTQDVFKAYKQPFSTPINNKPSSFQSIQDLTVFLKEQRNDLENIAIEVIPEIKEILKTINEQEDCLLARMSGTGPSCFGLFREVETAKKALQKIQDLHPNWWTAYSILT